ncbi:MAG: glycerol-3-phosphate dehydrogenase, partial [Clostridia bacterium]|nr:glycerol-3-phosphate dehydrogenase [Clostridia bacterium]
MKVSVLGCGRWGSFIAWYQATVLGNQVTSWGPEGEYSYEVLKETGKNEYVTLDKSITLTCDLKKAVEGADVIIISISSQGLRGFMQKVIKYGVKDKPFVLCMKGIEEATGKRLSEVMTESGIPARNVAVWVGPGHIQAFTQGIPNCMVIDSVNEELKKYLADSFKSNLIRFYYGNDLIGTEIGAAAKNVLGIAAGVLDGSGYVSLKGPLMARGAYEVGRLIKAMGGEFNSAYGLAHLGDYETTLFSEYSHNRMYGEMMAHGAKFEKLAEGVMTAKAM